MDRSLFGFVWRNSRLAQLTIIGLTCLSMPLVYASLEVPKLIIDEAIAGTDFPYRIFGIEFGQLPLLFTLCALFLALVIANNGIKFAINMMKGQAGERLLRRLRFGVFDRAMVADDPAIRRRAPSETTHTIIAELEQIGAFAGEIIATPVFQGATLSIYVIFIFVQDAFLGAFAIALYPVQAVVVPLIQARVIAHTQIRLANVRALAAELTENAESRREAIGYETLPWHRAQVSSRLFANYSTRLKIFRLKFLIKFLNNFMAQLTPFFFYSYGGYLVITGEIAFGALVAVLAAYKDLAGPWKELLKYYQTLSDMRARYRAVVGPFMGASPELPRLPAHATAPGPLSVVGLSVEDRSGDGAVEAARFTLPQSGLVAIIGDERSGRDTLIRALAGAETPLTGEVSVPGGALDQAALRARVAHVRQGTPIFRNSLAFNLAYGRLAEPSPLDDADGRLMRDEAGQTGNVPGDLRGPWYGAQGDLTDELLPLIAATGLEADVAHNGLAARIDPADEPELAKAVIAARAAIAEAGGVEAMADRVEFWREDAFNQNATLGENLFFHAPGSSDRGALLDHPVLRRALTRDPVQPLIVTIGIEVAELLLTIFEGVTKDKALISQFGLFDHREVPMLERAIAAHAKGGPRQLRADDRRLILRVAFDYCPAQHRLGVLDIDNRETQVVMARGRLMPLISGVDGLVSFDAANYVGARRIVDNLMHGKVRSDRVVAMPSLEALLRTHLRDTPVWGDIMRVGLSAPLDPFEITSSQRRKIGIARALFSGKPVIVLDGFETARPDRDVELAAAMAAREDRLVIVGAETLEQARRLECDIQINIADGRLVDVTEGRSAIREGN